MFKSFLFLFVVLGFIGHSNGHIITGKIGEYPIEMEVEDVNWETGEINGKYRYASKTSYLQLKGGIMQNVIWLEESYKDKVTGTFYLALEGGKIAGKWISGVKWYEVVLDAPEATVAKMRTKNLSDYAQEVSKDVSGGYATETYFLNDMWFQEDNPQMEIGFNGGALVLEEMGNDSLRFSVNTVCGPTYHIAEATGIAHRIGHNAFGCLYSVYESDTCFVHIELLEKSAHVWAEGNFACGFGARAYLDHTFTKITNRFDFEWEDLSIGEMKKH